MAEDPAVRQAIHEACTKRGLGAEDEAALNTVLTDEVIQEAAEIHTAAVEAKAEIFGQALGVSPALLRALAHRD